MKWGEYRLPRYHLHTLALRLRPGKLDYRFHNVRVPDAWRTETLELQSERLRRDQSQTTVPTDNLNLALRALFPDLLAVGKNAWRKGQPYWLLADQPLPLPALTLFVREWANASFSELSPARRSALLDTLRDSPLTTLPETIDLAAWTTRRGTAYYDSPKDIYNLLPHFVAAKFCRGGVALPGWGDFNKPFYRVPLSGDAGGAEIMSWPPEKFDGGGSKNGNGADYFSVFITFTLQTVPFDPHPVIHCDVGLRRWASRPLWGFREACSVYLFSKQPWFAGGISNSFTVAPMRRFAVGSNTDGSAVFESGWGKKDALTQVLRRANLSQSFPAASEIFDDPLKWLTNTEGVQAAMTWATDSGYRDSSKHRVGAGLPPLDRQKLWEWVCDVVGPDLEAVNPIPLIGLPAWTPTTTNPFFPKSKKSEQSLPADADEIENVLPEEEVEADSEIDEPDVIVTQTIQNERSDLLKNAVGSAVEIGLHYDSEALRARVETTLFELFGVAPRSPQYQLPNGVTIYWSPVKKNGPLYGPLFLGENPEVRLRNSQVRAAIEQRRDALKAALPPAKVRAVCLVELEDYRKNTLPRVTDPKTALRKGFAQSRRLTQFLAPPLPGTPTDWQNISVERSRKEQQALTDLRIRTTNAVLDALRQLGVQMPLRGEALKCPLNGDAPPSSLQYVGFWLAKHTRSGSRTGIGGNLPLFVKVNAETGEVTAQALSVKNEQGFPTWMPYSDLLLQLGCDNYDILNARDHNLRFLGYTQERVHDLVGKDYVLFAHAQNCRKDGWHYLANAQMETNRLGFERGKTSAPMTHSPGLRVVRVRDDSMHETPESFVCRVEDSGEILVPAAGKGVYPLNENAFFVRIGRPVTMKDINATMSKLSRRASASGKNIPPQAGITTSHLRLLEVTPFGLQPGDDPFAFAALTLRLCDAATHFGGSTTLPLPLHLAEQIEEYLHPLPTDTKDEEDMDDMP